MIDTGYQAYYMLGKCILNRKECRLGHCVILTTINPTGYTFLDRNTCSLRFLHTNDVRFVFKKSLKIPREVIRIRISNKNRSRQHNTQKKKYKRTNNDLQNIHIKLKIELCM
jgi:hypothetical protein